MKIHMYHHAIVSNHLILETKHQTFHDSTKYPTTKWKSTKFRCSGMH